MFDSFQGLGIDIDVETDSVDISEENVQIFSSGDVVNNEVLTGLFRSEIDSSDVGSVELDGVNVNLEDILVDLLESFE